MNFRPILYITGIFLLILGASMTLPMAVDLYWHNDDWKIFFVCIIITVFFGGTLYLTNAGYKVSFGVREAFFLTVLSWLIVGIVGAMPFWLSELNLSVTDAFFESISGITTTGSTVIVGLENVPPGILLWRALLQWLGGIGIIVMALSVLPFLKVGGMQLFRSESSQNEKVMPRVAKLSSSIAFIYVAFTLLCVICYALAGLTIFDSVAHAMTTIATGGFSTFDASIGAVDSLAVEITAIIFMIVGSLPFVLYLKCLSGNPSPLLSDVQVRAFIAILGTIILVMTLYIMSSQGYGFGQALRYASLNVTSIMTGTGYTSTDFGLWGPFAVQLFFFTMVIGGCAGSTTCGIKVFRFQVLYSVASVQIKKLLHPHGVFMPQYNNKPLPKGVASSVLSFFFLFALCFCGLSLLLSLTGLDYLTAMSGAATSLANVGPGLGSEIGPAGTFKDLPDASKWVLCLGMLLGRLELFTILVLISPHFWQR